MEGGGEGGGEGGVWLRRKRVRQEEKKKMGRKEGAGEGGQGQPLRPTPAPQTSQLLKYAQKHILPRPTLSPLKQQPHSNRPHSYTPSITQLTGGPGAGNPRRHLRVAEATDRAHEPAHEPRQDDGGPRVGVGDETRRYEDACVCGVEGLRVDMIEDTCRQDDVVSARGRVGRGRACYVCSVASLFQPTYHCQQCRRCRWRAGRTGPAIARGAPPRPRRE